MRNGLLLKRRWRAAGGGGRRDERVGGGSVGKAMYLDLAESALDADGGPSGAAGVGVV
jgi:hypothetical protein